MSDSDGSGGLSLGQSSTSVSEAEGDQDLVSSAASTPGWDRELSPASTLSPDRVLEEYDERHSPAPITPVKHCPEADVPASPSASFQIVSPLPSPARLWPSVPSTPTRETAGYMSDESDSWVPRRRAAARRVVVSDDDEEPAPRKSQARGLRGRIPAAIAKLNAADSEDELEGGPDPTTEASYDVDNEESMGSLRDFIVDSDCEEEIADGEDIIEIISSDEEEESQDIDCGDDLPVDSQGIPIIDLVSDSDECDEEDSPLPIDGDTLHFLPPPPPVALPDMGRLSLEPPSKPARAPLTPSRTVRKAPMTAREWATRREQYAQKLFNELDSRVFGSKLSSCGATIEWGARLRTTAGQAHHSKRGGSNVYKIVLSNKVLSTEREWHHESWLMIDQIRDTLAHEMCHLACWVISNEHKNPHGRVFKSWGSKVHAARPDIIVTVS